MNEVPDVKGKQTRRRADLLEAQRLFVTQFGKYTAFARRSGMPLRSPMLTGCDMGCNANAAAVS